MMNEISILNLLSIFFLTATIVVFIFRWFKNKFLGSYYILLVFAVLFLLTASLTNFLEHSGISSAFDKYEDFLRMLYLPFLIFSVLNQLIYKELQIKAENEIKFKGIFNGAFSFIGLLDLNGALVEANDTALNFAKTELLALKGLHFSKTPWWSHSSEEQEKLNVAIEDAKKGKTTRFVTTHLDSENKLIYVDFSIKPAYSNKGILTYLIVEGRDITASKKFELELIHLKNDLEVIVKNRTEELEAANEELTSSNEELQLTLEKLHSSQEQLVLAEKMASIGVLAGGVAHEINNPMNFVKSGLYGFKRVFREIISKFQKSELLNEHDKLYLDEKVQVLNKVMKNIDNGVNRTTKIVKSLNTFSDSYSEKTDVCDVHEIIDKCLSLIIIDPNKSIEIKKNYSPELPPIHANGNALGMIFTNLITNAVQSIKEKGNIFLSTFYSNPEYVKVEIRDTGVGISKKKLDKILDPFFTTKEIGMGKGLGLSMVYGILKRHNGDITFSSEEGKGTTVELKIPIS
ncbi:PAS domain-containing sensor histidine kinase [Flexithrix dorotheae]|uniref:PAS domain-containing sensor histidine kinase n=1 Tax=Flexithrix dorotheae TaxID=70993 RepID=UPI000477068F|nr:ATP-binding protein [Flexithrix dorotheae]